MIKSQEIQIIIIIVNKIKRIKKSVFVNVKVLQVVYVIDAMNYYVINVAGKINI